MVIVSFELWEFPLALCRFPEYVGVLTMKSTFLLPQKATNTVYLYISYQLKPTVTHGERVESYYQKDLGKFGEVPRNRRIRYKNGLSSTTLDLFHGTTRETHHVRRNSVLSLLFWVPKEINREAP